MPSEPGKQPVCLAQCAAPTHFFPNLPLCEPHMLHVGKGAWVSGETTFRCGVRSKCKNAASLKGEAVKKSKLLKRAMLSFKRL